MDRQFGRRTANMVGEFQGPEEEGKRSCDHIEDRCEPELIASGYI